MKQKRKRNNERTLLPNGCSFSHLTVNPANWQDAKANIEKDWYIHYRFYDPSIEKGEKYFNGKAVAIRGMNKFNTLSGRRQATKTLLENEKTLLLSQGYNPITEDCTPILASDQDDQDYLIHPDTPFSKALQKAFDLFEGASKIDLKSSLKYLQKSVRSLQYQDRPVKDIKKRHLIRILENCKNIKQTWNNNQFNHYRSAFISFYKIFVKYETVEYNLAHNIEIKPHAPERRKALTPEQRIAIDQRLKKENYRFWNFVHLFFHSGARLTEMARLQGKHVNLDTQSATYLVKKGKAWVWVERPISDEAIPFWERALEGCKPEQYIFSKGLKPNDYPINSKQYTRRWEVWVKKPIADLNKHAPVKHKRINWMDVSLYDLKHTRTTELSDSLYEEAFKRAEEAAARANGHTTTKMVKKVYDIRNKIRKDDKIKKAPIKFA